MREIHIYDLCKKNLHPLHQRFIDETLSAKNTYVHEPTDKKITEYYLKQKICICKYNMYFCYLPFYNKRENP